VAEFCDASGEHSDLQISRQADEQLSTADPVPSS
jgi:hypothetical protein